MSDRSDISPPAVPVNPTVATSRFRSAGDAAAEAARMIASGEPLKSVWRYAIVQMLDDYESALRHQGSDVAGQMWSKPPEPTGEVRVDAALAALAEHLARRDGWLVPAWARETTREATEWWFVTDMRGLHPRALVESPLSFRRRGVFITSDALVRM